MRLFDLLEASPLDNPAFLKWFVGSKVVDAQGQPLRVYHGTAKEFDGFSGISNGIDGIYFSSAPSIADQYADYDQGEGEGGQVYPTYLSMKNPLVIDYQAYLKKMNDGIFADERDERGEFASEVVNDIVDTAKDFGKDGVILHGIRDGWTDNSELATTFIVFNANQIKSVFNKGTWNPNTPKLSESVGSPEFHRWFRNSKIVDRPGQPLAVHHGTAIPKTQFRSFRGHDMHGIYFTPNRDAAQDHADMDSEIDGDDPLIISVYLSIQNPLIVSGGIVDDPRVTGKGTVGMMDYQQLTTEMLNLIVADGYDGIVITDGTVEDASEIVAFNSNQVKSVDNRGGWNPGVPHLHEGVDIEPDWGVRLGSSFKLWRGESESSGSNGASYGAGLYTTTNRSYAAKYGKVREVPRWEALPDNPLRFRTIQDWELWLQRYDQYHGILGARDRGQKHNDIGDYIRIVFPKADGVQIGSGTDAMFVAWPANSIQEAVLNELRIIKDQNVETDKQIVVAFRGRVWLLPWHASMADEAVLTDMAYHLGLDMSDWEDDTGYMMDSFDEIIENRPDIIYGTIRNNDLHLMNRPGASAISPMTSPMIAKLVKQLGLDGASYGYTTMDGDDDTTTVGSSALRGALPKYLYHGTSSDYLHSIVRTGIRPGVRSNWTSAGIQHKSIVFGAVGLDGAIYHANRTAGTETSGEYGADDVGESFPVILQFAVPDQNQIVPDYDVAASLIGDEHPVSNQLGYTNQGGGSFGRGLNTMVADQNPEGRAWKSTGIFGYTGRIPAKFITQVFTNWEPGQTMDDPEWVGTLQEFFQEWTARYEGEPEDQDDEIY